MSKWLRPRWMYVGGAAAVALLTVTAVILATSRDDGGASPASPPATETPAPAETPGTATAVGEIVDCPVEHEVCDFAVKAEAWVRARDAGSLIADGSAWDNANDIGILRVSIERTLPAVAWPVRLASIGCPRENGQVSCAAAFSLTFTTLSRFERTPPGDTSAILTLGFQLKPGEAPALTGVAIPTGDDRVISVNGAQSASCNLSGQPERTEGECINTTFFPVRMAQTAIAGEPPPCPSLAPVCERALEVERQLAANDFAGIAGGDGPGAALKQELTDIFDEADPRLIAVGCPFGAVRASCTLSFALAFTTLDPADNWTTGHRLAVLRFEGSPETATYAATVQPFDADTAEALIRGGFAVRPCGMAGMLPGQPCNAAIFEPYWSDAPFLPEQSIVEETLTLAQPERLPAASTLFTATARCWACDEPDSGIQRHQLLFSTGEVITATILESNKGAIEGWTMGQVVSGTPNAAVLAVMVCDASYCGALGSQKPEATWRVMTSKDMGATWQEAWRGRTENAVISSVTANGFVVRAFRSGSPEGLQSVYAVRGGAVRELTPPAGLPPRPDAAMLADGSIVWIPPSQDGLVVGGLRAEDGSQSRLQLPPGAQHPQFGVTNGGETWASWFDGGRKVGIFRESGELAAVYAVGDVFGPAMFSSSLGIGTVSMTGQDGSVPALLDFEAGTITPIGAPFGTTLTGRNRAIAYRPGI